MRVVLDTNIMISSILSPQGISAKILDLAKQMRFEILASEAILQEYEAALNYSDVKKRHGYTSTEITALVEGFYEFAAVVVPSEKLDIIDDPDDNKFLECAIEGNGEIIITRDPDLLSIGAYKEVQILTPTAFLRFMEE